MSRSGSPGSLSAGAAGAVTGVIFCGLLQAAEPRRYLPADTLDTAYERAYAQLVANGDCLPVYAAFRDAAFDCGERQGMRSVAVRSDAVGPHLATEMVATALVPDESEFARAGAALDELTIQITSGTAPAADSAPP